MDLPNLNNFTLEDFLTNPSFRKWVFDPDEATTAYWTDWFQANPNQQSLLNYSFSILHSLYMHNKSISDDEVNKEIEKILAKIRNEEAAPAALGATKVVVMKPWTRWAVAAAVLLIAASVYLFNNTSAPSASYEAFVKEAKKSSKEFINSSDSIQVHHLPDGSIVSLYKKSKATYALSNNNRQVYMEGKAFFDVKKNSAQPFVVYTDNIVTKVLGTSFTIDAYPTTEKVAVVVRSGKVSVYKRKDFTRKSARPHELGGLLVTPNQQVVLDKSDEMLVKQLVENPVNIAQSEIVRFHFSETPVNLVFEALMKEYAINILYDEETLHTCTLTARLENESFFDKLNIITQAIGSTYIVIDGNVVINSSAGCK